MSTPAVFCPAPLEKSVCADSEGAQWWRECCEAVATDSKSFFANPDAWYSEATTMKLPGGLMATGIPNVMKLISSYHANAQRGSHQIEGIVAFANANGFVIWEDATEFFMLRPKAPHAAADPIQPPPEWEPYLQQRDRQGETWDVAMPCFWKRELTRETDGSLRLSASEGIFDPQVYKWATEVRGLPWLGRDSMQATS